MSQIPPSLPPAGGPSPARPGENAAPGAQGAPGDQVTLGGGGDGLGQLLQDVKDLASRQGGSQGMPLLNPENSGKGENTTAGCGGGGERPPCPHPPPDPPCPNPPSPPNPGC